MRETSTTSLTTIAESDERCEQRRKMMCRNGNNEKKRTEGCSNYQKLMHLSIQRLWKQWARHWQHFNGFLSLARWGMRERAMMNRR